MFFATGKPLKSSNHQKEKANLVLSRFSILFLESQSQMTPCIRLRPVEAGLKVDSGAEGVHPDEHLCEEETEEDIPVCNIFCSTTSTSLMLFVHVLCNFQELGEPVRLVVVLDCNAAGVEENQEDHRPVEPLLLHHPADHVPGND